MRDTAPCAPLATRYRSARAGIRRARGAARREPLPWRIKPSSSWLPMVYTGLRHVIGSWKIMLMLIAAQSPAIAFLSVPPKYRSRQHDTLPLVRCARRGSSPMMASAVIVLPEPDLADNGERFASPYREIDIGDRMQSAGRQIDLDRHALHIENGADISFVLPAR